MGVDVERKARNQSTFRRANEDIRQVRDQLGVDGATPFVCECGDELCREIVRLTASEYEHVRSDGAWFLVRPGHDNTPHTLVAAYDGYSIVAKIGEARQVAEADDPRAG